MTGVPLLSRLSVCLACVLAVSAGLDWSGRLLAAEQGDPQSDQRLSQLLIDLGDYRPCNKTSDCCDDYDLCECEVDTCMCVKDAYWQSSASACVKKADLGQNCTRDVGSCLLQHSSCQYLRDYGYRCECDYQYYPDTGGRSCVRVQSPFFTTTIIVSICILFAAVAIGVIMQIRSNMQRRLYQQQYRRRADLDQLLVAQRHARQRRAAQRRANPTRRYSEEAEPDEPPPPYVAIFTTRSSGDWGKLPSYQEALGLESARQENAAFEMEEGVFSGAEETPSVDMVASPGASPASAAEQPAGAEGVSVTGGSEQSVEPVVAGAASPEPRPAAPEGQCSRPVLDRNPGASGPAVPTHRRPPSPERGVSPRLRRTGSV